MPPKTPSFAASLLMFLVTRSSLRAAAADRQPPMCRVTTKHGLAAVNCSAVPDSDLCCSSAHKFTHVRHEDSSPFVVPESGLIAVNVSFYENLNYDTDRIVIGRAGTCSVPSECYEVNIFASTPIGHGHGDDTMVVEVAFLPEATYQVMRADDHVLTAWHLNDSSEECHLLTSSTITFDLIGNDAFLHFHPSAVASVSVAERPWSLAMAMCVTIYSDSRTSTCSDGSRPRGEVTRVFCHEWPFEGVIHVPNVTRWAESGNSNLSFHCAEMQIGRRCFLTSSRLTGLLPAGLPAGLPADFSDTAVETRTPLPLDIYTLTTLPIVAMLILVVACSLCHLTKRRRSRSSPTGPEFDADFDAEGQALTMVPPPLERPRVVMLYLRERDVSNALREVLECAKNIEVIDPHDGPMFEEAACTSVGRLLSAPDTSVLVLATPAARTAIASTDPTDRRPCDIFHQHFVAAVQHVSARFSEIGRDRIFMITMDGEANTIFPNQRTYFLPDRIQDLLKDIPSSNKGGTRGALSTKINQLELNIRRHLRSSASCQP